jgi:hypothetical protein
VSSSLLRALSLCHILSILKIPFSAGFTEEQKNCLRSLHHADHSTYRANVAKHHPGTLQWILENEHYKHWINPEGTEPSRFLWVSGNPGCGKTVLARFLLDHIEQSLPDKNLEHSKKYLVLYFFFDDKYDKQKSAVSLLKALLHQAIQQVPDLIEHATAHWISEEESMAESLGTLWTILCDITSDFSRLNGVYLVVDALDECDEITRNSLLNQFQQHFDSRPSSRPRSSFPKVLVTSRPNASIERLLRPGFSVRPKTEDYEGNINGDITSFISYEINELRDNCAEPLLKKMHDSLTNHADGMFLWASLMIEDLQNTPVRAIRNKLEIIPSGLDHLYQRLLDQLAGDRPGIATMATRILMWVANSPRPMTSDELAWACACTSNSSHKSVASIDASIICSFRMDIKNCGPIPKVDSQHKVKLVHQSA